MTKLREYIKEIGISIKMSEDEALESIIESHKRQRKIIQNLRDRGLIDFEIFDKFFEAGKILKVHTQPLIKVNTIWKCIEHEDASLIGETCIVKSIEDSPDFNGEGHIELLYSNDFCYIGKLRRFIPNITHVLMVDEKGKLVK